MEGPTRAALSVLVEWNGWMEESREGLVVGKDELAYIMQLCGIDEREIYIASLSCPTMPGSSCNDLLSAQCSPHPQIISSVYCTILVDETPMLC